MRKIVLFVVAICTCGLLFAQQPRENQKAIQEKLKEYKSRYAKGERDRKFMREYVSFLQEKRRVSDLEKVADEYLQTVPFKKRYTGENFKIFTSGVRDCDAVSFKDLVAGWERVRENREELSVHVENVYKLFLMQNRLKKQQLPAGAVSRVKEDLEKVQSPNKDFCLTLLDMCVATDQGDDDAVVRLLRERISPGNMKQWNSWDVLVIISPALGFVLESADKVRCEEMMAMLKPYVDPKDKSSLFNSSYQNFEGKLLLFDAESRKAVCSGKPDAVGEIVDNGISGFMFNTSWGGVMTDKEYNFLREVYSSSDDTLKLKHLHTLLMVFRYNGYTPGLEALKPLIEKNVKDCEEKREVLSRYKTYAHLAPGKPAPEFKLKDMDGKEHALSDYRGKVVVVDVWATWCGGCIQKLPYFLKTRDNYKGREDIVFLVISIDQKGMYNKWKFAHPRYNLMDITSLVAHPKGCTFSDDYNITGIPRYFVIDREGKIVNVYAPAPDSKRFDDLIQQTLNSGK